MKKCIIALFLGLIPIVAMAQNGPVFQPPTALTSPATLSVAIASFGTGTIEVQATSVSSPTFSVQCQPTAGVNWVTMPMTAIPAGASSTSQTTAGNWLVSTSGFANCEVNLTAGSGTFGISAGAPTSALAGTGAGAGTTSTPLTPAAISPSSNLTLAAANTWQTLVAANACPNFLYINNAVEASNEGIATAEPIFVNITGGTAAAGGGGSSIEIAPGVIQPFVSQTTAATWVAATIGHKINAVCE